MQAREATPSQTLHARLARLLRAELAIDLLGPRLSSGSFRSFSSRAISVIDVRGSAIDIRKSASRASHVHLLRVMAGSAELRHADGCVQLHAGQFVTYGGSHALQFRHEQRAELLTVIVPARALERWLPDWQAAEFVVAEEQAEGRLSFEIARDLLACSSQLQDPSSAELVGETVARLLARALGAVALADTAAPADLAEAQRRKVRQFCRQQLGSPALTVELVARATGLSRASLHRLFRDQPHSLMQWVQLERLEACRRILDEPGLPTRTLTEIALSQGFRSSAHFSASFRQRYGLRPRDYRRSGH